MGVAVLGDEVLVCEDHNEGTIMVYDKRDFKYLRRMPLILVTTWLESAIDMVPF